MEQKSYKKIYKPLEFYTSLYKGIRTIKYMRKCKKNKLLSEEFIERIMLAVTEVNGCEVCSYAHTKIALEQGMDKEEIQQILSGDIQSIPADEAVAIFFAQHYADTRGKPSKDSWQRVVEEYGKEKSLGILGAIRMIMIGNIIGIPISAFASRLKKKPIKNSSLLYELGMMLSIIVFLPVVLIHVLIAFILRTSIM